MFYTSTRSRKNIESARAIAQGIAEDGGLFVPESFPRLTPGLIESMVGMSYKERAVAVLSRYLTDYTDAELRRCVDGAYTGTFDNDEPAPLREVLPGVNLLELWHGPTCAFKDIALQLLPHLLTTAAAKTAPGRTMVILVATSGDTGKAALEMTTQTGDNVAVCAIKGNFDDAQTGVKAIFADASMREFLEARNMEFSSANSINFGRLVPQIVYYVSAYCDLLKNGKIKPGEKFNVVVPTGNFGNILAAYYAKQMGIPVARFICASNSNNILTDFIRTGTYDRNRPFHTTTSPSMDILISSNLERLLYHLCGDAAAVADLMKRLKTDGRYAVSPEVLAKLQSEFYGGFCDDAATAATIGKLFREHNYLCDTHTGVAVNVYEQYRKETGDDTPCVIASTASPYKFAAAVLPAVYDGAVPESGFDQVAKLSEVTGTPVPAPLAGLKNRPVLHKSCTEKEEMSAFIRGFLESK